jgi:hypothetical protein
MSGRVVSAADAFGKLGSMPLAGDGQRPVIKPHGVRHTALRPCLPEREQPSLKRKHTFIRKFGNLAL